MGTDKPRNGQPRNGPPRDPPPRTDAISPHRCTFCHKVGARLKFAKSNPRPPRAHANGRALGPRPEHDYYAHTRCFVDVLGEAALLRLPAEALGTAELVELRPRTRGTVIDIVAVARALDKRRADRVEAVMLRRAERQVSAVERAGERAARRAEMHGLSVRCPTCNAQPGITCASRTGRRMKVAHPARRRLAKVAAGRAPKT